MRTTSAQHQYTLGSVSPRFSEQFYFQITRRSETSIRLKEIKKELNNAYETEDTLPIL